MRKLTVRASSTITIRIAGRVAQGHLSYVDQLVTSAIECGLWPLLDLKNLQELDLATLRYFMGGEGRNFGIVSCPQFAREWMLHEKECSAA